MASSGPARGRAVPPSFLVLDHHVDPVPCIVDHAPQVPYRLYAVRLVVVRRVHRFAHQLQGTSVALRQGQRGLGGGGGGHTLGGMTQLMQDVEGWHS